MDGKEKMISWM